MTVYSPSSLGAFKTCPLKYKFSYIDRIRTGRDGIEAFNGNRVHDVLERLYNDLRLCKTNSLDDLLALFDEVWEKEYHEDVVITKEGYTLENYQDFGRKCIRNYYETYQPFDQAVNLGTEVRVNFSLNGDDAYQLKGFIDRLDQRADGTYEIHDYKTAARLPDERRLESDRQLGTYNLAVRSMFADAENVELIWHYPAFAKEYKVVMDEAHLESIKAELIELIDAVESATEYPPKESALCGWCDFQQYCPCRKHLCKVEELPVNEYLKDDGVVLVNRYAELKEQEKELSGEIEKVKEALYSFAEREGVEVIRGNSKKVRVTSREVIKYPGSGTAEREDLEAVLSDAGLLPEVSSLSVTKLASVLESGELPEDLANTAKEFGKPEVNKSVRISNLKDSEINEKV